MKISQLIMHGYQNMCKTGKPNIPRYLYHVTSKKNYESMLKDTTIFTSKDVSPISNLEGVFLFDMKNLVKRWGNTLVDINEDNIKINLASTLLNKNSDVVLLRIPTRNLDANKLKIRVQQKADIDIEHAKYGASAQFQSLYTRRKKPIEYIYGENIDMKFAEKIGETKNVEANDGIEKFCVKPYKKLLEILGNQPERKQVEAIQNSKIKDVTIEL